jgi:hypothetical protein
MDESNPYEAPRSDLSPPESGQIRQQRKRPSSAFVGSLIGPLLGVLFSEARIGPAGHFWWQGKGGETLLTYLGYTIAVIVIVGGAIGGALCGMLLDARFRPGAPESIRIE